jgi:hypothetical protein
VEGAALPCERATGLRGPYQERAEDYLVLGRILSRECRETVNFGTLGRGERRVVSTEKACNLSVVRVEHGYCLGLRPRVELLRVLAGGGFLFAHTNDQSSE